MELRIIVLASTMSPPILCSHAIRLILYTFGTVCDGLPPKIEVSTPPIPQNLKLPLGFGWSVRRNGTGTKGGKDFLLCMMIVRRKFY